MAIKFLSSENIAGDIDVTLSKNGITYLAVTNTNTGVSANARVQVVGESSQLDLVATSAGYTGVTGWADSGIISTDSGASGGLKLNSQAGGIQLQSSTTSYVTMSASGLVTFGANIDLPNGSVTAPSISNTGDTNTGMYWPGDHEIGFTVNGSRKMYMTETKTFFQNQAQGVEINNGLNVIGQTETDTALVTDKLGIGAINNSFNLYNNGTTYLNGDTTVDATFVVSNTATTSSVATQFMYGKRTNSTDGPIGEIIYSNNGDSVATLAGFRDGADDKGSLVFQTQNGSAGFGTRLTIAAPGDATFTNNLTFPDAGLSSSASATNFGVYTSEIRLIDTPNGGLKQCRVITDNYGEWILVGRYAASAMTSIQGTWSSESGLDTSTSQSTTTKFSADFGDSYPTEVRIMGSTDFTKWRDTRTIDFIYGVPEGRAWKYFFSGGAENGMTSVGPNHSGNNKFGWNINGSYDGFGRWVNPDQTSVGMSDTNVTNPSAAYTTATANAFNWHTASDAKMTVSATRTFSGQDSYETAGFGKDDTVQGFFDEYPNEVTNMQGGVDFSSAVWVLIKLPTAISSGSGGGSGNQWVGGPTTIHNTNTGSVGIGTSNPVVTGKGLEIQNIGNDTTASLKLTGHNNTGTPGLATSTELKHFGEILKFAINHNGTDAITIGSSASTIGFTLANTTELGTYPTGAVKRVRMAQGGEIHFGDTTTAAPLGVTEGVWDNFGDQDSLGIYSRNHFSVYSYGGTYSNPKLRIDDAGSYFQGSNFGIGETSPTATLQVNGDIKIGTGAGSGTDSNNMSIQVSNATYGDTANLGLLVRNNGTNGQFAQIGFGYSESKCPVVIGSVITDGGSATKGDFIIGTRSTTTGSDAPTERMRIASTGQIVFPRTGQPPITNSLYGNIVLDSDAVTSFQRIRFDVGTTAYWGLTRLNTGNFAITGGSTWNDHALEIDYATQNVFIDQKLAVGQTTAPGRMLEVNGGTTNDGGIKLTCSANLPNFWSGIEFRSSVATSFIYMASDDADGTLKFLPDASLKGSLSKAGTWTVAGDVVAYGSPSDKRLKENIKPIESALDKVSKLQGITFDWKESDSILNIKEDIGFIAQDVQKVVPELVRENEDGMLSMRHQGIAPILLEAIKEQQKQIDRLEEQIKKMCS